MTLITLNIYYFKFFFSDIEAKIIYKVVHKSMINRSLQTVSKEN